MVRTAISCRVSIFAADDFGERCPTTTSARVITNGVPDAGMPAFKLQAAEVTSLIAFIRAGFDVSGTAVKIGDPARGQALFAGKAPVRRAIA